MMIKYDKIIVWGTKIIDGSTVEVCWAHKEDDIEAELYIRKDFYDMKWSRYKLYKKHVNDNINFHSYYD